ncbi:uncharacterized protein ppp1r3ab [Osmerus eperlanus]|uniref:uncharacterized protein ppp1r3ab n=1 Tax=Osmerus eperlanus TaxID=29151 RepID=UPI002E14A24F
MWTVTRLHLSGHSMLNVSCQKHRLCGSPSLNRRESPMEPAAGETPTGAGGLLGVPGLSGSWDGDEDEEEEEVGGIKPKSSPCPRRKTSVSSEDSELELPPSRSRRVSFADVLGLSLVSVKEFDAWDVPRLPGCGDPLEGDGKEVEEYDLSTLFTLPLPSQELALRVRQQKLELESVELLPGTSILRGVIRVLNLSFDKMLYVRTSLDAWASHFDLLAEYVPGSGDGVTDCFSFKLTLVPASGSQGARVDFCLRYETPIGTFWANNSDRNYVLFCHQKVKETKEKLQSDAQKKSCLKAISQIFTTEEHFSSTNAEHTGVPQHEDNKPVPNIDSMGATEEQKQKLMVESRQNCTRRNRRKEARMARVRDYFSQRDDFTSENKNKPVDPSQPLTEHNTLPVKSLPSGPETQPQPLKHNTSNRLQIQSDSMATLDKTGRPSTNEAAGSQDFVSAVGPITSDLGGSEVTIISNTDEHAPSCQTDNMSYEMVESILMQMENTVVEERGESDDPGVGFPDDVVSSAVPVSQTSGVTFGTVLAPLYHQVFCQVESDRQNVTNKRNQTSLSRGRLHDGKSATGISQRYASTHEIDYGFNLTSDSGGTHVEQSGNQREPLKSDAHWLVLGLSGQSKPVSDEADRCVPRTGPDVLAPTALIPEAPQGPSEADHFPHQAKRNSSSQIPPEVTSAQTQIVDTTSATTQSVLDMVGLQTQTLVRVPENPSPEMVPQESWGPNLVSVELPEERGSPLTVPTGERSTGTDRLHTDTVMSELIDGDLRVESSTTKMPNHPSIESKPSVYTLNANNCVAAIEKDGPVFHKDCISLDSEKGSDKEEDGFQSDDWCGETNLPTEGEGGGNIRDTKDVIEYDSKSEEGDKLAVTFTEKDVGFVEDHDGSSKDPHFDERQKCDNQNVDEKDWEKIVEEEEDMWLDEDGEESKIDQDEREEDSDERVDKVLEELVEKEKMVEQEQMIVEEKEQEEMYVDECRIEEIEEREVELDEKGVEMDESGVEIEVEGSKDEIKEEDDDELQLEEEEMVEDEEEIVNKEDGEEIIIGRETDEVEIGERDEYTDGEQDQIGSKAQNEAADHLLTAEHRNSTFESGSEVERVNANNSKNTDVEDSRWERNEENLYIVEDAPYDDCADHDNDQYSVVREEMDSVKGDGPLRAGKPCYEDGDERSISTESLSDDEMDLYLHSLRAAQKQGAALAEAGCSKDTPVATSFGKRPSISRSKQLPSPMPSISESVDEEQPNDALEDLLDFETVDEPPVTSLSALLKGEGSAENNLAWWRETFSFHSISKALMYSFLLVVFFVVAYHYDFLACFTLYLFSVLWLCCQGEKQTERDNTVQERTSPEPVTQKHPSV